MDSSTTNPPAAPDPFDLGIHTPANLNRGARAGLLQKSPATVNVTIGVSPGPRRMAQTPSSPLNAATIAAATEGAMRASPSSTFEQQPVSIIESANDLARERVEEYNAKLMVFQAFCAKFEEAAHSAHHKSTQSINHPNQINQLSQFLASIKSIPVIYLPPPSTPAKGSPVISTPCPTPLFPSAFSRLSQPRTVAKQLEEASVGELPPNPTIEDLPKVVWKNRRFVQEDSLARKGAKGRKSWIRSHGMFFIELNHQDQPIGHVWCCSRCDTKGRPEFFSVQATSSAADHLRKAHRITPASQSSPSDDSAIDLQSHATPKLPRLDQSIIPKAKVKAVQELSVGFVIDSDVPFTIFEHKFLKELFYQFDHELALQIPWSSSSITRELQKIFESKADIIKAELGSALTKIHISFDLWTSPNRLAIMAVFAHFIDKFGNQQSRLLALRRQLGIHSGENLAETLFEIVQLWDIRGQVGTVISDNVTTNDTCLSYFYRQLDPSIRPADIKARRMRCYGHVLNLVARAFLFGKDAESFELESDINGMRGLQEQDLRHWRSKGPIGKLHNIVKFIRSSPQRSEYFKRIAHEQEDEGYHLCEESTAELEVILNNETRWNSTYMMIERALRKQTDIRAYIFALEGEKDEEKRIPADDILSNEDWRVLGEVNEILTPLYHQTMRTQGWGKGDSHGRLWEVLVGMEYLLEHFEDWKGFYNEFTAETIRATNLNDPELIGRASAPLRGTNIRPARSRRRPARFDGEEVYVSQQRSQAPTFTVAALPEHSQAEYAALDKPPASKISQKSSLPADHRAYIRASINNGWKKLDEYYSKLGESPLFAAAVILHPRFGISWLEATWATEEQLAWVRDAKAGIKDYFARWYQSNQRTDDLQSKSASSLTNKGKEDDHYTQWINSRTKKAFATSSSVSEMDKYLRLEPQDTQEPIQWWRDHKPSFPVLSSFALDVFAIPAMATDCERQFSLAKLTLTSQRLAMGADTLERVHCLRNWVRHGGLRLPNQVDSILRDFRDYFDRHYAQGNQAPVSPDSPPAFHGSKLLLRTANFPKKARKEAPDGINLYLQMVPEEDFKEEQLLQWWLGRKTQFPRLFNMAMDLLSISAMSSENERVFSAAKLTISSQRNALHWVTVEALQCLRNWARTGAISWAKPRGHQDTML
ncbi:hypothetical protein FOMA001_g19496 [Fusarium oxysporum f. sp. matthiolae]|nr:hypothetical protein FOMA001_g19496 [Fusarium oxysporum f. sp. matthiolae]